MIEELYNIEDKILNNLISTDFTLTVDGNDIPFENIVAESFELENSICDEEQFKLGGVIASQMKIKLLNIDADLSSKPISVKIKQKYSSGILTPGTNIAPSAKLLPLYSAEDTKEYYLFTGTVYSCKRQKNRNVREVIAFDGLYKLSRLLVKKSLKNYQAHSWYRIPNMNDLLKWILKGTDYESCQEFSVNIYPNAKSETLLSKKTISTYIDDDFSILGILSSMCEVNTCFAIVDGSGELKLKTLYDYNENDVKIVKKAPYEINTYSNLEFEEYVMRPIDMVKFPTSQSGDDEDKYFAYGSSNNNSIYLADNALTKIVNVKEAKAMVNNLYTSSDKNYIFYDLYSYRPFSADIFGRWWIEAGDRIRIPTVYDDVQYIDSFVLSRKIRGINSMTCTIEAKGVEYLGKDEKTYE